MGYLFNSLKEFILPENEKAIASMLGVGESEVSSVLHLLMGGILKGFSEKRGDQEIESILKRAGNFNILLNISDLFDGNIDPDIEIVSTLFLDTLFNSKKNDFIELVRKESGSSHLTVDKLSVIVPSLIVGFLGEKLVSGISLITLLKQVKSEKEDFKVPSGLEEVFKSTVLDKWKNKYKKKSFKWIKLSLFTLVLILFVDFTYNGIKYFIPRNSPNYMERKQDKYSSESDYFSVEIPVEFFFSIKNR